MNTPKNPNVWPSDMLAQWAKVEEGLRDQTKLEPHVRAVVAALLLLADTIAKAKP